MERRGLEPVRLQARQPRDGAGRVEEVGDQDRGAAPARRGEDALEVVAVAREARVGNPNVAPLEPRTNRMGSVFIRPNYCLNVGLYSPAQQFVQIGIRRNQS